VDTCVIYNSAAGRHRAVERIRRFKETWTGKVVFRPTEHRGHAIDLAREAALEGFATVAAAGGDGTVHEVATGLMNSQRSDVTFAVIPLGSANDYAHSVRHQFGAMSLCEPRGNLLDVGLVRTPDGREFHFFESLGTGLSAQVTLESNAIRWLQGRLLYGCAACRVLASMSGPTLFGISENGRPSQSFPTLLVSVMLGRREGGFTLAPEARLDDGLFDVFHARRLSRWQALGLMFGCAIRGAPKRHPEVHVSQCRTLQVRSEKPLIVHADGEIQIRPEDGIHELTLEILPGRLRVKVCELE
jgi:diacylglycerol kinase family enzyme